LWRPDLLRILLRRHLPPFPIAVLVLMQRCSCRLQ
jgi:hypothetical protein